MHQKLLTFLNHAWVVQVLGGLALAGILALIPPLRTLGVNRIRRALTWLSVRHSYPHWALALGPFAYLFRKPLAMPRLEPTPFKHLAEGILWRGILTPDLQATALKAFCPECVLWIYPECPIGCPSSFGRGIWNRVLVSNSDSIVITKTSIGID